MKGQTIVSIIASLLFCGSNAAAQEAADSLNHELQEVVVRMPRGLRKMATKSAAAEPKSRIRPSAIKKRHQNGGQSVTTILPI